MATNPISAPDLELRVQVEDDGSLSYDLTLREPRSEARIRRFRSLPLLGRLEGYLGELWRDLQDLYVEDGESGERAERRLAAKGAAFAEAVFPPALQTVLAGEALEPRSLLIISEEPRLPWEIAWISSDSAPAGGFFLGEAFAVGRWWPDRQDALVLPFCDIALVVADSLPQAEEERGVVLGLATRHRRVEEVAPEPDEIVDQLAHGGRNGWHFVGHGVARSQDAHRWALELGRGERLAAEEVRALDTSAGAPFVFFNSCTSGRVGFALAEEGGWAVRLARLGAGAFLGPLWAVRDRAASEFARRFYERFAQGQPIGEAVRGARCSLAAADRAARLSYALYAHPHAIATNPDGGPAAPSPPPASGGLEIPLRIWRSGVETPAALLLAEHAIVPLSGRDKELADLEEWCDGDAPVAVRLYTGQGGMGKTRLAIELCHRLWAHGWNAGFAPRDVEREPETWIRRLALDGRATLVVVDYADQARTAVAAIIRHVREGTGHPFRLILLSRTAWGWWDDLLEEPDGVGALLAGPATERHPLRSAAPTVAERQATLAAALAAFSGQLRKPCPAVPALDFADPQFEPVLILHMAGLSLLLGGQVTAPADLLDFLLARERRDWQRRARVRRIEPALAARIGRAMAAITMARGARNESHAIELLRGLDLFATERAPVLATLVHLLHEAYPGESWIDPLQPDTLGDHLAWSEMLDAGPGSDIERLFFASRSSQTDE